MLRRSGSWKELHIMQTSILRNALSKGKNVSSFIAQRWKSTGSFCYNKLIYNYVKCGHLMKASEVFNQLVKRDCCSWNMIISAYTRHGYPHKAITLFHHMKRTGLQPNEFIFASVLAAYGQIGSLEDGMCIHRNIMHRGLLSDVVVANALVDMYAKCGSIQKASELFDRMSHRDVVSWNTMIAGYTQNGFVGKALETFKQMHLACVNPNSTTFPSILPACAKMGALELGMEINRSIMDRGILSDVVVTSALVDMYAKCGSMEKASELFERMPQKNVVSWTAMIAGYTQKGFVGKALQTFKQMHLAGVNPNSTTFACILPACAKMGALKLGMEIHQSIMDTGILSNVVVTSALVDMYAKCGSTEKARELFDRMSQRGVVSWTTMIAGYTQNGFVGKALEIFKQMHLAGVNPDSTTFASILPACAKLVALGLGMEIHQSVMDRGILSNVVVASALVDMYAKCGSVEKASDLFDRMSQRDVISWTAMIAGYIHNGFVGKASETFKQMHLAGVNPDSTTFACILPACAKIGALELGMDIHKSIMEGGYLLDIRVASSLVDMYNKCGSVDKARQVFERIPQRNVASWTAMNPGYAR